MNRLQPCQFGLGEAVTFSVFYSACAFAVALFSDHTISFFNAWFHGLDLTLLRPPGGRPLTRPIRLRAGKCRPGELRRSCIDRWFLQLVRSRVHPELRAVAEPTTACRTKNMAGQFSAVEAKDVIRSTPAVAGSG